MALEDVRGTVLEAIWLSSDQRPAYRVEIFNPRLAKVQDVVLGEPGSPSYDISSVVERVQLQNNQVFEQSDDSVSSRADMTLVYPSNGKLELTGGVFLDFNERLFRSGTPIRIYEGDERVNPEEWPAVFTGVIFGYPGAEVADRTDAKKTMSISAFGRALTFSQQSIVGFSFGYGTDFGDAAVDLAITEMGLEREEIRFGKFDAVTRHKSNALTQISKMQGLYELMATVGRKPYFDSYGRLVAHVTDFDRLPVVTYDDSPALISVNRVQNLRSTVNAVQVTGLNHILSEVVSGDTNLGEYQTTIGYFDTHHREVIYYSDDKGRRAKGTRAVVIHAAGFGSSVDWEELDEFSGKLTIDTGYAPWVVGAIITVWTLLSIAEYIFDLFIGETGALGRIADWGSTPLARFIIQIAKASLMVALLVSMTRIGRYRVEIRGNPFEFVFEELRSVAFLQGVPISEQNQLEVTQHWLSTIEETDARAKSILRREISKSQPYRIRVVSNPIIEVDDIVGVRSPGLTSDRFWKFYVTGIKKTLARGTTQGFMEITAWKIGEYDA